METYYKLVGAAGLEPTTLALKVRYSTTELRTRGAEGGTRTHTTLTFTHGLANRCLTIRLTSAYGAAHRIRTCKPSQVNGFQDRSLTTRTYGMLSKRSNGELNPDLLIDSQASFR